ncbi:hypothetical protein [Pantoea sp. BAV 3049]|uniref:hypothetical protein n=1 Tax=Pantoea sp. BAV 3049 TaxID=2654188 RepID=UPI00131CAB75|nr:hypothetical protein [Pantoea sp. BAV 3049]
MSTNYIIAIPFFVLAVVFLFLGIRQRNQVFLPLGLGFMLTAVINGVVGYSIS